MKYTFELLSRGVLPWKDDEAIWRWGRPRSQTPWRAWRTIASALRSLWSGSPTIGRRNDGRGKYSGRDIGAD